MPTDPRRTREWKRVRLVVLERDAYQCQIRGPRCTFIATAVDHILPLSLGGEAYSIENLRAACTTCNSGRRPGAQRHRRRPVIGYSPPDPFDFFR